MRIGAKNPAFHGEMAIITGDFPPFLPFFPPFGGFRADLSLGRRRERCQGQQFPHPYQVIRREAEPRWRGHLGPPAPFGLPHRPDGLAPAEDLLNPFAHTEADGVAGLGRDGVGHGAAPVGGEVLGEVRRDAGRQQVGYEVVRVVGLVRPQRRAVRREAALYHLQRRFPLGGAGRQRDLGVDDQTVAVFHQGVAHEAAVGGLPRVLVPPGLRVGGRGVSRVPTWFPLEVDFRVTPLAARRAVSVLGLEALLRGPGFDQGAVDAEVFVGHQPEALRRRHYAAAELPREVFCQPPVAVMGEGGVVPYGRVHPQPHEPAEQQIEVQLLHELPLTAHGVEDLQERSPQQPLRRDRGSPDGAVEPVKLGVHALEDAVHENQDQTQRMLGGHPLFQGLVAKQFVLLEVRAAHRGVSSGGWGGNIVSRWLFQQPVRTCAV